MIGNEYIKKSRVRLEKHYSLIRLVLALVFLVFDSVFIIILRSSNFIRPFNATFILSVYALINAGLYLYFKKGHYNKYIKYFIILFDYTFIAAVYRHYYLFINLKNSPSIIFSHLIIFTLVLSIYNIARALNSSKIAIISSTVLSIAAFLYAYWDIQIFFQGKYFRYYYIFGFVICFFMFVTGLISLLISLLIKKYIISSSSLIRDIEERQKVEDKLSKATAFYENVLNSISDPLFVKDENMHFKVVNEAYSDFIGIPQDKLLGRNYNIFINKKEEEAAQISDEIAMDEGRGIEIEERYTDKLGFTRTLQVKKSFLLLNSHKYLVGIMRDISSKATLEKEMTRLIKELQKANNDLKDLTKMKEDFIAIASHDLRAPFEGILGFSNLLLNSDEISEENKEMIRCIVQSAEGQLKYVNSLLEIMSFEKGNIKLSKSSVDINNLVSKSVDFLNILAKKKHITLEIIHTDIVNANVDEPKISQVLNNFITNAIKFTPEEGVIKVDVKIVDDIFFRVDVIDSGIGINKKNAALIFDKYKTLSEGTNGEQGTGLGLYICKLMIRAHGGEIGVLKNSLKGSDFYFTLPLY